MSVYNPEVDENYDKALKRRDEELTKRIQELEEGFIDEIIDDRSFRKRGLQSKMEFLREKMQKYDFLKLSKIILNVTNIYGIVCAVFMYVRYVSMGGYTNEFIEYNLNFGKHSITGIMSIFFTVSLLMLFAAYVKTKEGKRGTFVCIISVVMVTVILVTLLIAIILSKTYFIPESYMYFCITVQFVGFLIPSVMVFMEQDLRRCLIRWSVSFFVMMVVIPVVMALLEEPAGVVVALALMFLVIRQGLRTRCPYCKNWFVLKQIDSRIVKERSISIHKKLKTRNADGRVVYETDSYIPGTERTYDDVYLCKNCGQTCQKRSVEKEENV